MLLWYVSGCIAIQIQMRQNATQSTVVNIVCQIKIIDRKVEVILHTVSGYRKGL